MSVEPIITPMRGVGPAHAHRIIAVASGKGGVGKTWFSITLAQALARVGRRELLFDGDLGLANVDIQLGVTPKCDLARVLAERASLRQAAMSYDAGGFDLISGQSGSGSLAAVPTQRLAGLGEDLRGLADDYDDVILDLAAGLDRPVRLFARQADTCLVIVTDEPTSLTDAYAFIKLTVADAPQSDLRIVVNMAATPAKGQNTYETLRNACKNFLHFDPPLAGIVRADPKVKDSIRHQMPLLTRHPNAPAADDILAIARGLTDAG